MATLVHQYLENSAASYPDKVAAIHDDDRIVYDLLNSRADFLAYHLQANGIVKGDRIALLFENCIDFITAYYAILKAGAVAAPINPGLKPDGLRYLLHDLAPAAIIANFKSERLLKAIDLNDLRLKFMVISAPKQSWSGYSFPVLTQQECTTGGKRNNHKNQIAPQDLASIIYTSGSTGQPKGVMLSHRNIVSNTASICQYLSLTHDDRQMIVLPFFYVMGKSLLNTHVAVGGSMVINNRFLYPADVVNQMIDEQVTGFSGVPSTYAYLLNRSPLAGRKDELQTLRYCSQAGGHMAVALKRALRRTLPDHTEIFIMYGATEASARLTYLEPNRFESKINSIGKPIPGVTIRILDEMGKELPDGCEGELVASGPNIMQGYWKDPQYTARVLKRGGYHTGDIGFRDGDGFLYVLSRKDGMLKVGGHRINPVEIEDFLMASELIIESIVLGIPDNLLGNKLIALVVPKDENCSARTLQEKCAAGLPNHKWPAEIVIIRSLPKNANGKIDRNKCVEIAAKTLKNDLGSPSRESISASEERTES